MDINQFGVETIKLLFVVDKKVCQFLPDHFSLNDLYVWQIGMTNAPHATHLRGGIKYGDTTLTDTLQHDGLTDAMYNILMGETAENIAKQYNISREEQDKFAAHSQNLTEVAQKNDYFKEEIVPVVVRGRKGDVTVDTDEYPKHGTTVDTLAKLRPCFLKVCKI